MLYSTVLFVIAYKYSGVPYFSGTFVLSVFLATVIHRQVVGVMSNISGLQVPGVDAWLVRIGLSHF